MVGMIFKIENDFFPFFLRHNLCRGGMSGCVWSSYKFVQSWLLIRYKVILESLLIWTIIILIMERGERKATEKVETGQIYTQTFQFKS